MADTVGRWECGPERGGGESSQLGRLFDAPVRGWPFVFRQARTVFDTAWGVAEKETTFRELVGRQRDRLMRWAVLKPEARLLNRLVALTDGVEELAGAVNVKALSSLRDHATFGAGYDDRQQTQQRQGSKAGTKLPNAARVRRRQALATARPARALDAAQQAEVRVRAMRWLLGPVVVVRVVSKTLDAKPRDPKSPVLIDMLRQAEDVIDVVQLATGTSAAALAARQLELTTAARWIRTLPPGQAAAMRAEVRTLRAASRELASATKTLGHVLSVVQVTLAAGDVWAHWRRGDRAAAGLEAVSAVLPIGLAALPGGMVWAVLYGVFAKPLLDRWTAEAKASPDDLALRDLLKKTEFGSEGAAGRRFVSRGDVSGPGGYRAVLERREKTFEDTLYRGRRAGPTVGGDEIRRQLYLLQWVAWLARLPAGPELKPGAAAAVAVQFRPVPGQCRRLRARLRTGTWTLGAIPFVIDLTADAEAGTDPDGKPEYTARLTVTPTGLGTDVKLPTIVGYSPPPEVPQVIRHADCVCSWPREMAGKKVPAVLAWGAEPVFFIDPGQYGDGPLVLEGVRFPAGGTVTLVFGPAPPDVPADAVSAAAYPRFGIELDVLTPVGTDEAVLAVRRPWPGKFLSIKAPARVKAQDLLDAAFPVPPGVPRVASPPGSVAAVVDRAFDPLDITTGLPPVLDLDVRSVDDLR
jgi:hypothetical protein